MRESSLRTIFERMSGHCHFCGDPIKFENRGWSDVMDGHWEVDHVIQRDKGGVVATENCLPACTRCNRLRWHRTGESLRHILLLGIIARKEIKSNSRMGRKLAALHAERLAENEVRRRPKLRAFRASAGI